MKKFMLLLITFLILAPVALFAQDNGGTPDFLFPAAVLAVVGAFAPVLIQVIVKAVKESWARYIIALGISGIFGLLGILVFNRISLSTENIVIVLPAFATWCNLAWKLWWHKLLKG